MGDGPDYQLHTDYFHFRLEVPVLGAWIGAGHDDRPSVSGNFEEYGTGGAYAGVRGCFDILRPTSADGATGAFSGVGGGACYAFLYDSAGNMQHRAGAGFDLFVLDNRLMFPIHLNYIYREVSGSDPQHGGVLNIGVRHMFWRDRTDGRVLPFWGADIGLGGMGNRHGGFGFLELQAGMGVMF
ncbi:MAG TPA: hypothetical protein VLJ37_09435 [bacterium]|nr:hypothetical protein [bacterium]